jgi:site-specific recombinase XerD
MADERVPALLIPSQPAPNNPKPIRSYANDNRALVAKFSQWLEIQNYSVHIQRAYDSLTADFCRFIGSRSLTEIKHPDVREYFAFLQLRGMGSRSLDQKLYGLRALFEFLTLRGAVTTNVARFIKTRKRHRNLPQCPSVYEMLKIIEAAESCRDRAILERFYATGCRLAEVSGMRCEDIDLAAGVIRVTGKGDKQRIVLFGRSLIRDSEVADRVRVSQVLLVLRKVRLSDIPQLEKHQPWQRRRLHGLLQHCCEPAGAD